jgi:hypothetical protein
MPQISENALVMSIQALHQLDEQLCAVRKAATGSARADCDEMIEAFKIAAMELRKVHAKAQARGVAIPSYDSLVSQADGMLCADDAPARLIEYPASLKTALRLIASTRGFPGALRILARGGAEELVVESRQEAQTLVNVARLALLEARLKFPNWDEDSPDHDLAHEEAVHDVLMGLFEKTVGYVGQGFDIVSQV